MAKKDYHVVPQGEGWAVKREGAERASSLLETQRDAIHGGKRLAQANKTELDIHRPNGRILSASRSWKWNEALCQSAARADRATYRMLDQVKYDVVAS